MPKPTLNILITRPEVQGRQLAQVLENEGYYCICQPFFSYQANADSESIQAQLATTVKPIVIFVSAAAVEFAAKQHMIASWNASHIIAVGQATSRALHACDIKQVICPEQHDSEGILTLAALQDVTGKDIVIVRGDGGRELIADTLKKRGAKVQYIESYQKHWLDLSPKQVEKWQNNQVNCVIITSNALLERFLTLLNRDKNIVISYWMNSCLWIVVSDRLVANARQLGLKNVICANGASDAALLAAISDRE